MPRNPDNLTFAKVVIVATKAKAEGKPFTSLAGRSKPASRQVKAAGGQLKNFTAEDLDALLGEEGIDLAWIIRKRAEIAKGGSKQGQMLALDYLERMIISIAASHPDFEAELGLKADQAASGGGPAISYANMVLHPKKEVS